MMNMAKKGDVHDCISRYYWNVQMMSRQGKNFKLNMKRKTHSKLVSQYRKIAGVTCIFRRIEENKVVNI